MRALPPGYTALTLREPHRLAQEEIFGPHHRDRARLTGEVTCHTLYDMNESRENRVNARIDDATQERLNELILATGRSISHVVREAIAVYHVQVHKQRPPPRRLLAMVGTGRSKDGRTDVSVDYKQLYAQALEEKYVLSHPPAKKKKSKR